MDLSGTIILVYVSLSLCTGQQVYVIKGIWSECTLTCGGGTQFMISNKTNTRFCNTLSCPGDAGCLSTYLSFEHVTGKTIYDESNNGNVATMKGEAKIVNQGKFGKALRLTKHGSVSFDVINFHNRPTLAITIALWLYMSEINRAQEIFYTCGNTKNYNIGAYHITVDGGIVKWSQKDRDDNELFSLVSGKSIEKDKWYHIASTHRLSTGKARLFINGKIVGEITSPNAKLPKLSDWVCADMGNTREEKPMEGLLDEFYIFKCELLPDEISELYSNNKFKRCEIPRPSEKNGNSLK